MLTMRNYPLYLFLIKWLQKKSTSRWAWSWRLTACTNKFKLKLDPKQDILIACRSCQLLNNVPASQCEELPCALLQCVAVNLIMVIKG